MLHKVFLKQVFASCAQGVPRFW